MNSPKHYAYKVGIVVVFNIALYVVTNRYVEAYVEFPVWLTDKLIFSVVGGLSSIFIVYLYNRILKRNSVVKIEIRTQKGVGEKDV